MNKQRVWALVKLPDGRIVKQLVSFQGTEKLEKRITDDFRKKLWLNETHYKHLDERNADSD